MINLYDILREKSKHKSLVISLISVLKAQDFVEWSFKIGLKILKSIAVMHIIFEKIYRIITKSQL